VLRAFINVAHLLEEISYEVIEKASMRVTMQQAFLANI